MKKYLLMTALVSLLGVPAMAEEVTMVADQWCPYNCDPKDSAQPGFFVELAKKILEPKGYTVKYTNMPWTRALDEVRKGTYDIAVAASKEEAPDFKYPDAGENCGVDVFAVKSKNLTYTGLDSLKDHALGGISAYSYTPEIDKYIEANKANPKLVQLSNGETALNLNIRKLLENRFDFLFENGAVFNYTLNKMKPDLEKLKLSGDIVKVGNADKGDGRMCYLATTPAAAKTAQATKLLATINDGVKAMQADGSLAALRKKYSMQ